MDRKSKHLNSEERGVIFAEHQRGNSQQGIGRLLGRPPAQSAGNLRVVGRTMAVTARRRRGVSMLSAVDAVGANASWSRVATSTALFTANLYICAGHLSRSRTDCGA